MGVNARNLDLLIRLKEGEYIPASGAVMEIGAQQLDNSFLRARSDIEKIGALFGANGPAALPLLSSDGDVGMEHLSPEAPFARVFWQWLGLEYASIDVDGSPGSIPLDLNQDDVPPAARGKYHVVTNFGTTEHVANQLHAFKIIHDLCVPGGVMIHHLPAQGAFDHGFFNYTPKFFWRLMKSNEYRCIYFDYREDEPGSHEVPEYLAGFVTPYEADFDTRKRRYHVVEANLMTALQKRDNRPFLPPVDLPDFAVVNEAFDKRYRPGLDAG